MATLAQVAAYRAAVDDLTTLAVRDLNRLLGIVSNGSPVDARKQLILALPELINPYVLASGMLAATWYEDLRHAAIGGTFYATASGEVNRAQINSLVRWGVKPLFGQSNATVLSLIGGGVQRIIANAGRDTIDTNILRDKTIVGYARIPQPGACAFCGLMASKGAVYRSAQSARFVVGRGVDASIALDETGRRRKGYIGGVGGGVKARGSQDIGHKYHDFCRCVATPVFAGGDNSAVKETAAQYMDLYRHTGGIIDGRTNLKATLSSWREEHGTK